MGFAEQYMPLAKKQASYYSKKFYRLSLDDIQSVTYLALVEAEREYDSSRGIGFAAYATGYIRNKMLQHFESENDPVVSLTDYRRGFTGNTDHLGRQGYNDETHDDKGTEDDCLFATEEQALDTIEFYETFRYFLKTLKEDEQFLVGIRVDNPDLTQKRCAELLGKRFGRIYYQNTVSTMLKKIERKYSDYDREESLSA